MAITSLHSYEGVTFIWLYSCEQNSGQTKSDPLPEITKKFKRYQHETNNRESTSAKKREKSPTRKRETVRARKQMKSSSSITETPQKQSAAPQDNESAPEQQSDMPLCAGKQRSRRQLVVSRS